MTTYKASGEAELLVECYYCGNSWKADGVYRTQGTKGVHPSDDCYFEEESEANDSRDLICQNCGEEGAIYGPV